ncbi:MAG: tRNA (guanosine(46)-N7)-methyltransferase TrmB [Candidatus Aquirickettsiella sp.]
MNQSLRPIRSFVHRQKKLSKCQQRAFSALPNQNTLSTPIDFNRLFERESYTILEIGFGMGDSLLQQALQYPENNYLGIEVHRPGIALLLTQIEKFKLNNIKVIYADVTEILTHSIPKNSLDVVQIFFPDPWPKTRHHKRRLVQAKFIDLLHEKLKLNGKLHLATDWQDYAQHMLKIMENASQWQNTAAKNQFTPRPPNRPLTKFEKRGQQLGHAIWDLVFLAL